MLNSNVLPLGLLAILILLSLNCFYWQWKFKKLLVMKNIMKHKYFKLNYLTIVLRSRKGSGVGEELKAAAKLTLASYGVMLIYASVFIIYSMTQR